jgi:hypothetical protein
MSSSYHATVHKVGSKWAYHVFGNWDTGRPVLLDHGTNRNWHIAFGLAAGTVRSFRSLYEYKHEDRR